MGVRLLAGLGMTLASLRWLHTALHPQPVASA